MSDKSFGDHINRNIVKNSLLSSAVVGLSLEDLTHKAVLLPATPSQGEVTRIDQPQGSQVRTLAHADHDKPSLPSGDAYSNISLSNTPSNIPPNRLDSENNEQNRCPAPDTRSKASVKSEDDFDVNEYIARLQGTRYVSAPLHSHIKEPQNTSLPDESLEEINLNDAEQPVQQSLTADIAQNFSQLPTVLPHVASAVFSSFSNMLSMKSREQTPDDTKSSYEAQVERPGVPLMGVEDAPKDFGLPPKEPPVAGVSSYRITSKKKYAQFPGLSQGGGTQNIYHTPNLPFTGDQHVPPFMTLQGFDNSNAVHAPDSQNIPLYGNTTVKQNTPFAEGPKNDAFKTVEATVSDNAYNAQCTVDTNVFNPVDSNVSSGISIRMEDKRNTSNISEYSGPDVQFPVNESQLNVTAKDVESKVLTQGHKDIITPRIPIIPPPPMFSNPRSSQTTVGKSVLPPSVARRISANQPLIKPQVIPTPALPENIFVPTIPETDPLQPVLPVPCLTDPHIKPSSVQSQLNPAVSMVPPASSVPILKPPIPQSVIPFFTLESTQSTIGSFTSSAMFTPSNTVAQAFGSTGPIPPPASVIYFGASGPPNSASVSTADNQSSIAQSNVPFVPIFGPSSEMPPQQVLFNPSVVPHDMPSITQFSGITPEPAKPLVEPPKAVGMNFRMTKKRPQYYSGPIEGVGDISNNVKPIIAPVIPSVPSVDTSAYAGSFFTPEQQPQTVEENKAPNEVASVPFDISKPVEPAYAFEPKPQCTPYDINQPPSYTQEYNTAFDVSRTTTEAFEQPKQEAKGFGIIGSLKSKLSSIDINKIQSTVTTFFDPAYNEAKGKAALETAPYSQQQYGQYSQEQNNFEIMVPSVEQNQYTQFGYQQGYNYDQNNQYYQTQNAYSYQNEGQNASSYFTEPSCSTQVYTTVHSNTQEHSSATTNYTQENIPGNVDDISQNVKERNENQEVVTFYNPEMIQDNSQTKVESVAKYPQQCFVKPNEDTADIPSPYVSPNIGTHGAIGDIAVKAVVHPQIGIDQTYKHFNNPVEKTSFFDTPIIGHEAKVKAYDTDFNVTKNAQTDSVHNRIHFSAPLPPAMSFFDSPIGSAPESKKNTVDLVNEMDKLAMAEEIAIASSPFQAIDLQISQNSESKLIETCVLKAVGQKDIPVIALDKNVQNFHIHKKVELGTDQKGISLIESLSKDTTPVVAVSSVPLFGLSALITDQIHDAISHVEKDENICLIEASKEIKPLLEKQTSFSFFENVSAENKLIEDTIKTEVLSISDAKNVLLIEPPEEDLGTILQRKASSSMLKDLPDKGVKNTQNLSEDRDSTWKFDADMVTSKDNVNISFDRKASGFFDHQMLLKNSVAGLVLKKETNASEQASDFNICETCREVKSPDGKDTENVTNQLIENINSSIQLSNPVEVLLTESNPTADDRAFENKQFDDINRITEDTIETLQGHSTWNFDADMVTSKDNVNISFDRKASGFFDHLKLLENPVAGLFLKKDTDASEQASDFNICETCREVKSPDGKDTENVTNQLIENINSSIQLSNPVEVLLTESNPTADDRAFENKQFDDINRITEDTIETLTGQSATELLDSVATSSNSSYGWNTEQLAYASIAAIDQEFVENTGVDPKYSTTIDPQYTFKIDPNAIGFFGDNSLFFDNVPNNASDEIKAEFKTHEDVILPSQISIPSAPPAEDDSKSDETGGLDVHSIEQDANKDFPLEEEFVIEPSETDDDKLEFRERKRSTDDSVHDTFADRIEKFKSKAGEFTTNDDIYQKNSELVTPPKSMASYFDTGNYAVETHYRNSLTSPTNINTYQAQNPIAVNVSQEHVTNVNIIKETVLTDAFEGGYASEEAFRLPPGFEDELRRQFIEQQTRSAENKEVFIPETSTQTRTTTTATSNVADTHEYYAFGSIADKTSIIPHEEPNTFAVTTTEQCTKDINFKINKVEDNAIKQVEKPDSVIPALAKAFGSTNILIKDHTQAFGAQIEVKATEPECTQKSLPDPVNFFSSQEESKEATTDNQESFSRLASYFSLPPAQPDHSKSFFELSQSQNHYRHVTSPNNPCQGQEKTQTNLQNLMQDLTSPQNINLGDTIVRTVNYFSVEYKNDETANSKLETLNLHTNSDVKNLEGENFDSFRFKSKTHDNEDIASSINISNESEGCYKNTNIKESDSINTINTCKYCCNTKLIDVKDYKVKTAVDSDTKKEGEVNMSEKDGSSQKKSVSADFGHLTMDEEAQDGVTIVQETRSSSEYSPVRHHWFYRVDVEDKSVWRGFSMTDSNALEHKYLSADLTEDTLVPTDGGRYDVNIIGRLRLAVYWKEKPTNVRRCSWFYKGTTDARYVPYTEAVADKLEEEYRHGVTTGEWHRRLVLPNSELVVMHGPAVMVHFLHGGCSDSFSSPPFLLGKRVYRNPPKIRVAKDLRPSVDHLILVVHGAGEYKREIIEDQSTSRPRVVRRGHEESEIEDPEPSSIDHLLLLCHGVGSACDMRFRSVEEVVEDFRATSLQLLQSHYRNSYDNGIVSRVEVLPISWHAQLHVGEGGVDKRLNKVTLESIPRLRAFTNHTVLDALFYTSPVYHQTIIDTVCFELNRIYAIFKQRNPNFKGGVSLGGHSLGSVILYDLLCHQKPESPLRSKSSAHKSYLPGTSQPLATYPQLRFPPAALYALGSPIAIFECIRGVEALGMDFALPTCKNFFNIFHPYDPIAYRIEPLINPLLQNVKPYLIPHHKGRKRMHLELKDTMVRVGADLKQKLLESLRTTWNKWKSSPPPDGQLEKVVEEEMEKEQLCDEAKEEQHYAELTTPEMLGKLNEGRRIDYVLQEAPLEMINEYLFAMSSHVGYWESEDTMLLMLREIYSSLGVQPDCTVPQQSLTITRTTTLDEATIINEKECPSTSSGSKYEH